MPDEQGNLLPGEDGYVAPETVEIAPVEKQPVEEPIVVNPVEETVVEERPTPDTLDEQPLKSNPSHVSSFGNDFYTGNPNTNPDNELIHHATEKEIDESRKNF